MTTASAIPHPFHFHRVHIVTAAALIAAIAVIIVALRSQPEQHCVVSNAFTVMNEATGEIVQPAGQPTIRCFDTFAEAANYGSGGALNLPSNASEEEVAQALRERTIP